MDSRNKNLGGVEWPRRSCLRMKCVLFVPKFYFTQKS